ncbi:hypothetical protein OA958_00595 [Bacteroidota bacterium]|nr:hypothetical protein [Bacteroidota bacterium]
MNKLILFVFAVAVLGSCTVTQYSGDLSQDNHRVEFNKPNFMYVKTIEGSSYADYNGWGWDKTKAEGLVKEAKINMYSKHKLNPNQIITNVTKDILRSFDNRGFGTYKVKVVLSADVYEFFEGQPPKVNDVSEINKVNNNRKLEVKDNLEIEISQIMKGFLEYKSNQNLKKGTSIIFKAGDQYYKGKLKYKLSSGSLCYVVDVFSYKKENKVWEKLNKSDNSIPSNIIIGYKL